MNKNEQLALAIKIAAERHVNKFQKKNGSPYILHPIHIMMQLLYDVQLATIAILHDVIEDSDLTIKNLEAMGFSKRVTSALRLLTHEKDVPYSEYIEGICTNYDAIRVKRKDLEHNSNVTRMYEFDDNDMARIVKYHKSYQRLTEAKREFERK